MAKYHCDGYSLEADYISTINKVNLSAEDHQDFSVRQLLHIGIHKG